MAGGNDGINTVVPHGSDHYYKARPRIARMRLRLQKQRHVLQKQAAGQRQWEEEAARELERDREEIKACLAEAKLERNRCIELRRRLKKRWRRQWNGQLAALQHREQKPCKYNDLPVQ